jgi:hypothetical protein
MVWDIAMRLRRLSTTEDAVEEAEAAAAPDPGATEALEPAEVSLASPSCAP